jgi:hypothetical protein
MAADETIRALAIEQRKRLVGGVMSYAEKSPWWGRLTKDQQEDLRDKVLDSIGRYHDFMLDVIKVGHDDSVRNDHAIALIEQVHASQRELVRALVPEPTPVRRVT